MVVKKSLIRTLTVLALFVWGTIFLLPAAPCEGCFSIVAGKDASVDGYVIMAHNEDDTIPQIVNHHKIPRRKHANGEKVKLLNGGQLDQVEQTWAYIWSEMPGMLFSDSYINEWGVSITSDNCPSREDKPQITDGGIGYMLRYLVAERARTAREGVLLAGRLVDRFGYIDSGRTYIICDPEEGWLFCVVNGKHWLAQRVDDGKVAMVANTFTVHQVDLSDKDNFLASKDIIEYAVSRGWYKPEEEGPFDFARVYANPKSASSLSNFGRQWSGLSYIVNKAIPLGPDLPFSVVPKQKVDVAQIKKIMRHDYDAKILQSSSLTKNVDKNACAICRGSTQTSFVVQLRRNIPLDIGIVYWVCLAPPRTSFYIPFHFGIPDFPAGFSSKSARPSIISYNERVGCTFRADSLQAFWTFSNFYNKINNTSAKAVAKVKAQAEQIEDDALSMQRSLEEAACGLYAEDKAAAMRILANYSNGIYLSSMEAMDRILSDK
ncbi:MAG: C69 family dipeptidase [Phycisphaerae bacterium]|nr:C69 family dipeptidase [Phycisphaerae bacterium]